MNTTKILGEAVGIQSQDTVDKTEILTNEGLTSALIIGRFMRGRVDKPMTIHQGNIRGQLGYQPDNIDYNAVQDCLDTGVPSVQVLRLGSETNSPLISCAGATDTVFAGFIVLESMTQTEWDDYFDQGVPRTYTVNGTVVSEFDFYDQYVDAPLFPTGEIPPDIIPEGYVSARIKFLNNPWRYINKTNQNIRIKENPNHASVRVVYWNNPTAFDNQVCLSPISNEISCDGATNIATFNIEFNETDDFIAVEVDPFGYIGIDDFKIDGASVNTDSLDPSVVLTYHGSEDISEWADGAIITLNNETSAPRRFQFTRRSGIYPNFESNPTIGIDEDTQIISFCLAPQTNQISCEGATSSISFSHIQGDWRFYLDDFENSVISGLANDFSVYLNTEMDGKFISDFDGFFFIDNLDVLPHRFKMVPLDGEVPPEYTYSGENPTFMEHEDGSLTFCLAAKETPVTCYNFTQQEIENKPVFEKDRIFMAVNYKESDPNYAFYLDIQPTQLDDFFSISVNDVPMLFSDLLVNLGENAGYNVYWFRGETGSESNHPYINEQGLFIGYTADNTISFLYSNPSNINDVAVVKICSKVQTAVPTHLNYPEYRSIWFVDPFGEGPRFSAIDHLLHHIDANGFESIVLKFEASNS